jgi:hypothetical protein
MLFRFHQQGILQKNKLRKKEWIRLIKEVKMARLRRRECRKRL